jgi:hypothetical protein
MSPHAYTEDQLVEPAIALFAELGWQTVSALDEVFGPSGIARRMGLTSPGSKIRPRKTSNEHKR